MLIRATKAPMIAYDGTLVDVDDTQAQKIVIFRPSQPPVTIRPGWLGATRVDAALYSPTHQYLATKSKRAFFRFNIR
ncbi:hypothetical protein DL93DRAFT_2084967 [Clavulina sp. PMI_390]|nr:hypothetical protein DL93DRAFT_2084967 [Clavulina sp. PMI_390]